MNMRLCKICSAVLLVFLFPNPSPKKFSYMGPSFLTFYVHLTWASREIPCGGETGAQHHYKKEASGFPGLCGWQSLGCGASLGICVFRPKWPRPEEKHRILRRVLFANRESIWKNRGYLILRWASVHIVTPWKNFLFWVRWIKKWKYLFFSFLIILKNSI